MCTGLEIAALLGAGSSLIGGIGSLTGAGQNKPVEYTAVNPQQEQYQQYLMEMLKQKMQQPRPFAQMPQIYNQAMSMISPYYFGQQFQQPQTGWQGPQGYMGGGNMYGPSGMPTPSPQASQPKRPMYGSPRRQ